MKIDLKPYNPNLGAVVEKAAETEKKLRALPERPIAEAKGVIARAEQEKDRLERDIKKSYNTALPITGGDWMSALIGPEARGTSIHQDDGKTPHRFGYGEEKKTLGEISVGDFGHTKPLKDVTGRTVGTQSDELGARARLFGEASAEKLGLALGVEGELGARHTEDKPGQRRRDGVDRSSHSESFLGARARAFVEAGPLGATAGSEAFVGFDRYERQGKADGSKDWQLREEEVSIGIREGTRAHLGITGASASSEIEAGARYRYQEKDHFHVDGPIGVLATTRFEAFAGARAAANAGLGLTGAGVHAEAFAGVKVGLEERLALAYEGAEVVGGRVGVEGWAGVGARLDLHAGYDPKKDELSVRAGGGLAAGLGASVELEGTVGGEGVAGIAHDTGAPQMVALLSRSPRRV